MDVWKGTFYKDWNHVRFDGERPTALEDGQEVVVMPLAAYERITSMLNGSPPDIGNGPEPVPKRRDTSYTDTI